MDRGSKREWGRKKDREWEHSRGNTGWRVTRLGPHLFSASLPRWTINQRREQGKINKNSPAGTAAHRTIASLTDKSPQPSTSIKQLYSLTFHFLLSLHQVMILFPLPLQILFLLFSLFITVAMVDVSKSLLSHLYLLQLITPPPQSKNSAEVLQQTRCKR